MNTELENIYAQALIVRLSVSQYNPVRTDKGATLKAAILHNADSRSLNLQKRMLPKIATEPINKLVRELRSDHYKNTLPWGDDGLRLLPTKNWDTYLDMMLGYRSRFDSLVRDFIKGYAGFRQHAMSSLGALFDPDEYPDTDAIARRFAINTNWMPLPKSDDLRIQLGRDDMDEVSRSIDDQVATMCAEATRDLHTRLADKLQRVSERLSDPENVFRDSMIEGLKELCDMIPRLDVAGDAELEKLRVEVQQNIAKCDPQTLRDDDELRAQTKKRADDILRRMGL
jgi:hypothetical protein